jgi:hypothetical protein
LLSLFPRQIWSHGALIFVIFVRLLAYDPIFLLLHRPCILHHRTAGNLKINMAVSMVFLLSIGIVVVLGTFRCGLFIHFVRSELFNIAMLSCPHSLSPTWQCWDPLLGVRPSCDNVKGPENGRNFRDNVVGENE